MITGLAGLFTWTVSDLIEGKALSNIFQTKLTERLSHKAREQRTRFDQHIKAHHDAVKLFVASQAIAENRNKLKPGCKIIKHTSPPPWLPKPGLMRRFVKPRYAFLLNTENKVCEYYVPDTRPVDALLAPDNMLLLLSQNQSFITSINGKPCLLASEPITDNRNRKVGLLMLASPLDANFLVASQAPSTGNEIIALLAGDSDNIVVSSHPETVRPGSSLASLEDRFLVTGLGFFDYGASDITIKFASLLSTDEVNQLTDAVMKTAHQTRAITAVGFIVVFSILILWIVKRIEKLTKRVMDFSQSMAVDENNEPLSGDPIDILNSKFASLAKTIARETEELEFQALHDTLTNLPNRKLLMSAVEREIKRSKRNNKTFGLLMIDLDRFKDINDTLGHHMGDYILQQAAERLTVRLRDTDVVARLGGDEFGILLPETSQTDAFRIAKKIEKAFDKPFVLDEYNLNIGISIGIAEYPEHGQDENVLLQRADVAMYNAKRRGGGSAMYDPQSDEYSHDRLSLMNEMREALKTDELELHYQPIIDIQTNKPVCVESLLRWHHEQWEFISPETLIPLAEHTGLIQPLTDWVLEKAISQCAEWRQAGLEMCVAINMSAHNLHDSRMLSRITTLLDTYNVKPSQLHIELTESAIMTDPVHAKKTLRELYNMGMQVAIDDFGTGYSSLSYIKQLSVSHIKIDRSFVRNMDHDDDDAMIVRATIDLAHNLGLQVIAEGVENEDVLQLLNILGCDMAQGYYIGRPMTADQFSTWLGSFSKTTATGS